MTFLVDVNLKTSLKFLAWQNVLPGQFWLLQLWLSEDDPEQSAPPYWGAGLVHVLVLDCVPPPHSTEQDSHDEKELHPPATPSPKLINSLNGTGGVVEYKKPQYLDRRYGARNMLVDGVLNFWLRWFAQENQWKLILVALNHDWYLVCIATKFSRNNSNVSISHKL